MAAGIVKKLRSVYFGSIQRRLPVRVHGLLYRAACSRAKTRRERLRQIILKHYAGIPREQWTEEQAEVLDYLSCHPLSFIPYSWAADYMEMPLNIYLDRSRKMHYIVIDDVKIYFKRYIDRFAADKMARELLIEQDLRSPHRYVTEENKFPGILDICTGERGGLSGHCIEPGDVVADIGAAEAIFSRSVADIASRIYIFESDPDWLAALEETFKNYNEKIVIECRFVSDTDDERNITLDTYFKYNPSVSFLKADVEGAELQLLRGACELISKGSIKKASICVYHDVSHAGLIAKEFAEHGYTADFTTGLIPNWFEPYFVKGVMQARLK